MHHSESRPAPDSDEFLRLIFESAADFAIFAMDPNGSVTSWNPGAARVIGYTEADILGKSADVLFPPEEGGATAGRHERQAALRDGRAEDERWNTTIIHAAAPRVLRVHFESGQQRPSLRSRMMTEAA
jgi:PAS domain S-box-containing protein